MTDETKHDDPENQHDSKDLQGTSTGEHDVQSDSVRGPTITLDREFYSAPKTEHKTHIPVDIVTEVSADTTMRLAENFKQEGTSSVKGYSWIQSVGRSAEYGLTSFTYGSKALSDPDAIIQQRVRAPSGETITAKVVGLGDVSGDGTLQGAAARQRVRTLLGTGATRRWPLIASGFWITLETPEDSELLNLEDQIADEKAVVGSDSAGLALSMSQVFIIKHVMELIKTSIFSTNIEDPAYSHGDILKYIKVTDILGLVQFYTSLIYPNGYAFQLPCTAGNGCVNIDEVSLNLVDFLVHMRHKMTDKQCEFMASHNQKRTLKQIQDYQELYHTRKSVVVDEELNIHMNLHIPTVDDYIRTGDANIQDIIRLVQQQIGSDAPVAKKERRIRDQYNLSRAKEYSHCIESFITPPRHLTGGELSSEEKIIDPLSVDHTLRDMSGRPDITARIIDACNDFLEESTYTHVGIPIHTCTKCHSRGKTPDNPLAPVAIIPFDPINTFFILKDRKLQRAMRS